MDFLTFLSLVFGWIYTFAWSASFYTQPLLNVRRKSTSGTTVDFPMINTFGFVAYLTSNSALYFSPVIRAQYALRNDGHEPAVDFNDVVFAAHAVLLCAITTSQYFVPGLWGFERAAAKRWPSWVMTGVVVGSVLAVLVVVFVVVGTGPGADPRASWGWLDVIYVISYVKLLVTLIKYAPQLMYNFRKKSTAGWSIGQILLDFTGGILSIAQQGVDAYLQGSWTGVTGNPVKFALGNVSMLYDVCFMTQHYVLYREDDARAKDPERDALLGDEEQRVDSRRID